MKGIRRKLCIGFLGVALAWSITISAFGATEVLSVNGMNLWQDAKAQLIHDTTYVSIRTVANVLAPDTEVSWHNRTAWVVGNGITISARPGDAYIKVNDRAFYVPDLVRNINGSVMVPVRVVAKALGGEVDWSREEGVTLTVGSGRPDAAPYSADDLYWMSRIISAESRGEPLVGKIAVGTVVLNRVSSDQFPNNIYSVIFDRKWGVQFTPTANGTIHNIPTEESVLAAKLVLDGARAAGASLYFFEPTLSNNNWIAENREFVATIGSHWFYK